MSTGENGPAVENRDLLQQMKLVPELRESEEVIFVGSYNEDSIRPNAILVVTSDRLVTRPKKGTDEVDDSLCRDIELKDVQALRKQSNILSGTLELETGTKIVPLPKLNKYAGDQEATLAQVINAVIESANLQPNKTENEEKEKKSDGEENSIRAVLGVSGMVVSIFCISIGVSFVLIGGLLSLTIIGIPLGVLSFIVGVTIFCFGAFSGALGGKTTIGIFSEQTEWVKQ